MDVVSVFRPLRTRILSLPILVGLWLAPGLAQAVELLVPSGSYPTVQAAFSACQNGDIVKLAADSPDSATNGVLTVNSDCTLDLNGHSLYAFSIQIGSAKTFTIRGDIANSLLELAAFRDPTTDALAGIYVPVAAELVIQSGEIIALGSSRSGRESAGIGGQFPFPAGGPPGKVTINGGKVTAYGGVTWGTSNPGDRAHYNISGAQFAAGIGGANSQAGGELTIGGSADVLAEGGSQAAGIGGGTSGSNGGNVDIGGDAVVVARSRSIGLGNGAGIGGGNNGSGGNVLVRGNAVVTATGSHGGAGIGGGGNSFTANGGIFESKENATVTAIGGIVGVEFNVTWQGNGGDGIGAGYLGLGGTAKIGAGTTVTAIPGNFRASAIGGYQLDNGGGNTALTSFGDLSVAGTLRLPSGNLYIPNSDATDDEVVVGSTGVIAGASATPTVGAQIITLDSNRGTILNDGAIQLADGNILNANGVVLNHYYEVTLDTQGGSSVTSPIRVFAGSFTAGARNLPDPTKSGATFGGWYTQPNSSGTLVDATTSLTGSGLAQGVIVNGKSTGVPVTLYAHWEAIPAPNLAITKAASASKVAVGGTVTFTLTVHNESETENVGGTISDTVPDAFHIDSVIENGSSCTTTGQTVSCTLPTLAADATTTVGIVTTALSAGEIINTATVSTTDDVDSSDNTSSALVVVGWTLGVSVGGSGSVTGNGISCSTGNSGTCTRILDDGTAVELDAVPADGYEFTGWSGACSGTLSCQLSMGSNRSVTATFGLVKRTLTTSTGGSGSGTLTSSPAGIDCTLGPAGCSAEFVHNTQVTLTATAATGSSFGSFGGGSCVVVMGASPPQCQVTMDAAKTVTATFTLQSKNLTTATNGSGSGSLLCNGAACPSSYPYGTVVRITQSADVGSSFTGWSGDCSGTGPCQVTMDGNKSVTATFASTDVVPTDPCARATPTRTCTVNGNKNQLCRGTDANDTIIGSGNADVILGGSGNDTLDGAGGADLICAGPGNDSLVGGDGGDQLHGEGGVDKLSGGKGADRLFGGRGKDVLDGGPGQDRCDGGQDSDPDTAKSCETRDRVP